MHVRLLATTLLLAFCVLISCSSNDTPGNGANGSANGDGGTLPPGGEEVAACVSDEARAIALAADAFCSECVCAACYGLQAESISGLKLQSDPPGGCSRDTSAAMMWARLDDERVKLIELNPLRTLLSTRQRAAASYAALTTKAAASGLTDTEIVAALASMRDDEKAMLRLRGDFRQKVETFEIDAMLAADGVFSRWYAGTKLGPMALTDLLGNKVSPDDRAAYAKVLEVNISVTVDFEKELNRIGTAEVSPLTSQLLGAAALKGRGDAYHQGRNVLTDASRADAKAKAEVLKGEPALVPRVDEIRSVLLDKPSFEDIQFAVLTYRDAASQEIDLALGELRRRIWSISSMPRTDGLPDLGDVKPASVYLSIEELLRRYYDSDEWKRSVALFSATADQLWDEVEKETIMDDDVSELVKSDDDAEALLDALRRQFVDTLSTPAVIDCRDLEGASKDPAPCYVDPSVIQLVASHDQELYDRTAVRYLSAFNETFLKKGERLISRKTYDAELASYKDSTIQQYKSSITKLWEVDLCAVRNGAFQETIAARGQSQIGAFLFDACDIAFQRDWYGKRIDDSVKAEIEMRIAGVAMDIKARPTFRSIRENWVGDEKMTEVLTAAFKGASREAESFVRDYTKTIKRTSGVVKTVANVVVVVGATLLVPATGGASFVAVSVLTVGTAAGTVELVLTKLDDPAASGVAAFARGFASGAVPTLLAAGTSSLVFQLARTRLLSGATLGGIAYLENVTIGALASGSLHVVDSVIDGKPIDTTELLTHTLTGAFTGGVVFSAHTLLRVGLSHRIRIKSQKLLDPMTFEKVAAKLGYNGLAARTDGAGNVDWAAVYDDLAPLVGSAQGRAAVVAKLVGDGEGATMFARLVDGYGPTFVPPTVPISGKPASAQYTKIQRRLESMVHETQAVSSEYVVLKEANSALEGVCDYKSRVFFQDPVFWTDMVLAKNGRYVSRPVLSKFDSEVTPAAVEIQGYVERAKNLFHKTDADAFYGNIFPIKRADGTIKRGAIGDMLDDKVLCDLNIVLNPKMTGFTPVTEPVVVAFDGEITGVLSDRNVELLMANLRAQVEKVKGKTPAGGVYKTPDDGRKGFIIVPMLGGVRTKSGTVIDMNDPRLFPLAKRYYRVVKEEMMHTIQYRAKDGLVIFSDDLRSWYKRRFDRGTEESKLEFNARFNEELKYFHEVDITVYQTQNTMDPTLSTDELIRSYPQRLSFMKKVLNDPYERGRDFQRDWSRILQMQNISAGELRRRGQ